MVLQLPYCTRLLTTTNCISWLIFFFFFFSCSWKDVPDHQVHVWQLWQHISGMYCLWVYARVCVCVCADKDFLCILLAIPVNTRRQARLFAVLLLSVKMNNKKIHYHTLIKRTEHHLSFRLIRLISVRQQGCEAKQQMSCTAYGIGKCEVTQHRF